MLYSKNPAAGGLIEPFENIKPLQYPKDEISNEQPVIIWKDIHNLDKKEKKFRITIKNKDNIKSKPVSYFFTPEVYFKNYYVFKVPEPLSGKKYKYTIELLQYNKLRKYRYFNYLYYPIEENFSINSDHQDMVDFLPPAYLIKYKFIEKENILQNGYNILFFTTSSTISLGIGLLFFNIFDFGTISTVIWALCFTSSAIGYSASIYYSYRYMKNRSILKKILIEGTRASIKGGAERDKINTAIELSF